MVVAEGHLNRTEIGSKREKKTDEIQGNNLKFKTSNQKENQI